MFRCIWTMGNLGAAYHCGWTQTYTHHRLATGDLFLGNTRSSAVNASGVAVYQFLSNTKGLQAYRMNENLNEKYLGSGSQGQRRGINRSGQAA